MTDTILIDTGPLVAILCADDQQHARCLSEFQNVQREMITCWPVVAEAAWLLRKRTVAVISLLNFIVEGVLSVRPLEVDAAAWMADFFERFRDHEPQIADAALLYLAEREDIQTIFTLDRRDFSIYRLSDNRALSIVPEA